MAICYPPALSYTYMLIKCAVCQCMPCCDGVSSACRQALHPLQRLRTTANAVLLFAQAADLAAITHKQILQQQGIPCSKAYMQLTGATACREAATPAAQARHEHQRHSVVCEGCRCRGRYA